MALVDVGNPDRIDRVLLYVLAGKAFGNSTHLQEVGALLGMFIDTALKPKWAH